MFFSRFLVLFGHFSYTDSSFSIWSDIISSRSDINELIRSNFANPWFYLTSGMNKLIA